MTTPSTTTKPSIPTSDFPDRLSPMLVKELRQGLRTSLFTSSFIILQIFMVFTVLIGAAGGGNKNTSQFFWFFLIATLLVAMPFRGFNALSSELQLHTMELLQLTRLSAWRITLGKWTALMSQTCLLVISVLPYLVMRYFFGGVDLIQEFLALFFAFLGSALLTALAVGFSAYNSVLLRVGIIFGTIVFGMSGLIPMTFAFAGGGGALGGGVTTASFWWAAGGIVFIALYTMYFALDIGASKIAPRAENHATRKRLISTAFACILSLAGFFFIHAEWPYIFAVLAIALAWLDALTERPATFPSVIRPFQKNILFSTAKYLLTPGWHTGILYFICTAPIVASIFYYQVMSPDLVGLTTTVSMVAFVTYPLIFIHLFVPNSKQMLGLYILIQFCTLIIASFITGASESIAKIGDTLYYCLPIPAVTLIGLNNSNVIEDRPLYFLFSSSAFLILSLLIPFWRARPLYKQMKACDHKLDTQTEFEANRLL
ncbi:MAG: hypothetical protein L3J39_10720 [Verrucomicrobiales bacterium]|nr:hypothetical protein [Verrucomicrobiales bacterium]